MSLPQCLSSSAAAMSLRRSLLALRLNTNNFSLSKRRIFSLPDSDFSEKLKQFTEKLDPKATVSLIDRRPVSLRFRASSLIELSQLSLAAQASRLAVLENSESMIRNEIIGALCAAKRYDEAIDLYNFFGRESKLESSAVSFNHIIKAHCEKNRVDKALTLCTSISNRSRVDVDTLRLLTKGLVDTGRIYEALSFVKDRRELMDSVVYSYLIRGFLDLGNHDKAYELVDELNHNTMPDGHKRRWAVDATFVDYWLKQGEDERAMEIYRSLISRKEEEVVCAATGNALLEMLFDNGKQTEAWELFNAMVTNSKTFNRETFGIMVNVCFKLGLFKEALETFRRPELTRSSRCYANIIAKFCDRGMMSEAHDMFEEMCSDQYLCPDVPTFRSMINGYAKAGRVDDAIDMLKKMVDATLLKFAVHEAP